MKRALIICPGRGSYDRSSLGQLQQRSPAAHAVIEACDNARASLGRPTLTEIDAAERYSARQHVAGEHASLLTFGCGLADLAELSEAYEIVGVTGNSMGWYTALAASGALDLGEAIRLVETMGAYQAGNVIGGQLLYPISDEHWQNDPGRHTAVDKAIDEVRAQGHGAWWSIKLGGFAVLGADAEGIRALMKALPAETRGSRTFPLQLPMHSAFHTPLLQATSDRAHADLGDLAVKAPRVPLIDGRGHVFSPWAADLDELLSYTLGHQVVETYDFDAAVLTALHHTGPDVVIVLGPGNSLGGPLARLLVQDGWAGICTREDLDAQQKSSPLLLSFGVTKQRELLS
ncbi:MAG: ACP S-malonyltransferase [Proteobacteria bacterium]|nr:ACP S-malonyltransferase [Pseudomonadota bacterium]